MKIFELKLLVIFDKQQYRFGFSVYTICYSSQSQPLPLGSRRV